MKAKRAAAGKSETCRASAAKDRTNYRSLLTAHTSARCARLSALLALLVLSIMGFAVVRAAEGRFTWPESLNKLFGTTRVSSAPAARATSAPAPFAPLTSLLIEDFSYTAATTLTANGWAAHSAGGTNAITVVTPGLTYAGYPSSGVGNAVSMTTSGEDDNKTFTSQTLGTVYAAFMLNVSASQTPGDYFFHLAETPLSGNIFRGKVFVKKDPSSTNFAIGVAKAANSGGSINFTGFTFALNTTNLIVIKYTVVAGATNDTVDLFINPTPGGAEPAPTLSAPDVATADPLNIGAVALRQGTAANASTQQVDGIRIGTSWAEATAPPAAKYRTRQSGSWNDFNSWQIDTGGGFVDATAGQTPSSSDDTIQIQSTHTITVTASVSADQVTVDSGGAIQINPSQTLTIADGTGTDLTNNGTVSVAGAGSITNSGQVLINNLLRLQGNPGGSVTGTALTYGVNSTLEYSASGASQTSTDVEFPAASGPRNLTINNGSGVTLHAARTIGGTLDLVGGNFATGGLFSMANGSQITKSDGNMTGTPAGAGTYNVVYSGMLKGTTSELTGAGLTNVTVDMNPSQFLILDATRTVPGTLALTGGMVQTGGFTLIANGTVTRNNGMVIGNLQRRFTAAGPLTFDVGTGLIAYSPVLIDATSGTFPAQFTVSATGTSMPAISGPNKLNRFWTLTNTTVASANLTFTYLAGDVNGTAANYQFVKKTGGTLTILPPTGTPTSTSASINGVTSFSDWSLAEPSSVTTAFAVNNTGDFGDATPGNGICETSTGNGICTLRAAIQEANGTGGSAPIDINFSLGSSLITVQSELPLNHNLNINGPTASSITVTGTVGSPTRIFHTMPTRTVSISNLTVVGGRAALGAGLLAEGPSSTTTLTGMLIAGNIAVDPGGSFGGGGAMSINGGALNIYNSTVAGNTGTNGGGIALQGGGPINLVNVTVTANTADGNTGSSSCAVDGDGGGVAGLTMPISNLNLRNTIVAGNSDCNSNNPNASGFFNDQGNNLLSGNPMLNPVANNGGPTQTYSLQVLSPAIDSGDNCVLLPIGSGGCLATPLTTDQRGPGFARQADGNSNPPAVVDIGAFEKQSPSASSSAISGQIVDSNGNPVEGAAVRMNGAQNRLTVTDAEGNYHFEGVATNGVYTVVPSRANFVFSPSQRSFTQQGARTEAAFNGVYNGGTANPLDATEYFVRQQYLDFFGREPDEAGFNFWVNNIEGCGASTDCRSAKRTDTSAAFFLSIEFQQTGYLVYRMYQSAYGDIPGAPVPLKLSEFRPDSQLIGSGVVVNQTGWQEKLEANKRAFAESFVQRSRFTSAYPTTLSPTEFVNQLFHNAGVTPSESDRAAAIAEFGTAVDTADAEARGRALRTVSENSQLRQQEFNQAFVLMQYFGYLRRDPNSGPDADFAGYTFWLNKLDQFNGNFADAEMVKAFLVAGEYRGRFPK